MSAAHSRAHEEDTSRRGPPDRARRLRRTTERYGRRLGHQDLRRAHRGRHPHGLRRPAGTGQEVRRLHARARRPHGGPRPQRRRRAEDADRQERRQGEDQKGRRGLPRLLPVQGPHEPQARGRRADAPAGRLHARERRRHARPQPRRQHAERHHPQPQARRPRVQEGDRGLREDVPHPGQDQVTRPLKALAWTGGAALLAAAVTAAALGYGGDAPGTAAPRTPPATAKVTRTTLTQTKTVDGTLGHGPARTISARSQGTITWLPAEGATITRGHAVYSVDADRRPLLYGTMPLYRPLQDGAEGKDVELLERNLAALGYTGFDVDETFTWATREAVEDWQDDLGLDVTGSVQPGDVVVAPGRLRVADLKKALGDTASGPVLTATGTARQVLVNLDVTDEHLVRKGMKATVELPDGTTVDGRIANVGKVAAETGTGSDATTTVEVTVTMTGLKKAFDAAPVDVTIVSRQRENVLAVPVGALLALAEGGYGVQVVDGAATRYAAVGTGMFADGQVEVTGIDEGTTVAVPK
ncbi:MAG: efflux RND transporter periplasmic adaptor subunit [Nonomuraea sp.]|nr:efflux RND transporter periplasmic adaptor subunit [Nonomuraea sp.]